MQAERTAYRAAVLVDSREQLNELVRLAANAEIGLEVYEPIPNHDHHLDFVHVVEVFGREDGIYVFGASADAGRFKAAVEDGCSRWETPVNTGDAAERLIVAERGDVLEDLGWPTAAEDLREGASWPRVLAALAGADASGRATRLVKGWADEDAAQSKGQDHA